MIIEGLKDKGVPEIDILRLKEERRRAVDRFMEWKATSGRGGWYDMPREHFEEFIDSHLFMTYKIGLKSEYECKK